MSIRPRAPLVIAIGGAVAFGVLGLLASRPDIVAIGLPLAIWATVALTVRRRVLADPEIIIENAADAPQGWISSDIRVRADADFVQLRITQSERRVRDVIVAGRATLHTASRSLHSGPVQELRVDARPNASDGALRGGWAAAVTRVRNVAPPRRELRGLPLATRLTGLHGSHEGYRAGQGGDFRDIHVFAPGDELRRVDWRATARLARKPGELFVRRTQALSDASVVIMVDTVDDLGEVVASWGSGDLERSGATSLDLAREAARSIAAEAIGAGDRVAFHSLDQEGRSLRSGGGPRHLARVVSAIAATGAGGEDMRYRRTPPVPHGSVIFVLSTFFDGAAARLAVMWRAAGHRVVGVDTLPALDVARLTSEQGVALRILMAEREDVFHDLAGAGIDVVIWRQGEGAALALRSAARGRS